MESRCHDDNGIYNNDRHHKECQREYVIDLLEERIPDEYEEYEEHGSIEHGSRGHAGLPTVCLSSAIDVHVMPAARC